MVRRMDPTLPDKSGDTRPKREIRSSVILLWIVPALIAFFAMTWTPSYFTKCYPHYLSKTNDWSIAGLIAHSLDEPGRTDFQVSQIRPGYATVLEQIGKRQSPEAPRYLVFTGTVVREDLKRPRLLAVCDTAHDITPDAWFSRNGHAAGFSDGSERVLTPDEYAALDLTAFRPLDELFPSNSRRP